MTAQEQWQNIEIFHRNRARIVARVNFISRRARDIETDYEKLYGPFGTYWESALEACKKFESTYTDYLRVHDEAYDHCVYLFNLMGENDDHKTDQTSRANLTEIINSCISADNDTRKELDADIKSIREMERLICNAEREGGGL